MVDPTKTGTTKTQAYLISIGIQALLLALFWSVDNLVIWILSAGIFFTGVLYFLSRPKQAEAETRATFSQSFDPNNPRGSFSKKLAPQTITKLIAIGVLVVIGFIFFLIIGVITSAEDQTEMVEGTKELLREAFQSEPDNVETLTTLGNQFFESTQYDSALVYYEKVLAIDPNNSAALYNKGLVYYRQTKYDASVSVFNQYIQLYPEVGSAYQMQGNNYYERQIYESSFDWYKKAYALGERDPFLCHALGWLYDERQDWVNATLLYKEALQLDSTRADIYLRLAELDHNKSATYKKLYEQWRAQ